MAGIYPLLPDETCWFLAIDFDKSGWREDAAACLETSRSLNLFRAPPPWRAVRHGRGLPNELPLLQDYELAGCDDETILRLQLTEADMPHNETKRMWDAPDVVPSISYANVPRAADWLVRVLGFRERAEARLTWPGGCMTWLEIGDGLLNLSTHDETWPQAESGAASGVVMKVYVDDVGRPDLPGAGS